MSLESSSNSSTSKLSTEHSRYLSKYILSTQAPKDENNKPSDDFASSGGDEMKDVFNSENSQVTVEQVLRKITETAKILETPESRKKYRKNRTFCQNKKMNENFMSFSQLQNQIEDENKESLFNNSFEMDSALNNSCKIDTQWNCDTQLATLVDNADALLNMCDGREMTQCFTSKSDNLSEENIRNDTLVDKIDISGTVSVNLTENIACVSKSFISQPLSVVENVFKVPPLVKSRDSKIKSTYNNLIGSKSQTVEGSNPNMEPLLFSQNGGFKTASQKDIRISNVALQNAVKLFENIDDMKDETYTYICDAVSGVKSSQEKGNLSDLCIANPPLDFRETAPVKDGQTSEDELFNDTVVEMDATKNTSRIMNKNACISHAADNITNPSLNETYIVKDTVVSQTKIVDLQDWETFFNNTMSSSEDSKEQHRNDDFDSGEDMPSSPILISQKIKDKLICRRSVSDSINRDSFDVSSLKPTSKSQPESTKPNDVSLSLNAKQLTTSNSNSNDGECSNFVGFKTASNKPVTVSQESIEKVQNIFKDIVENLNENMDELNTVINDDNGRNESRKEVVDSCTVDADNVPKFEDGDPTSIHGFGGFKTASNKDIVISETALSKAKTIFNDIDHNLNDDKVDLESENGETNNVQINLEFKTANDKQIEISEDSFEKVKSLFDDVDVESEMGKINYDDNHLDKVDNTINLRTIANDEKTSVSKEQLGEGNSLIEHVNPNDINSTFEDLQAAGFSGFKTASDKQISVSNEALSKAKRVFENIDVNSTDFNEDVSNRTDSNSQQFGFKTASNKEIPISEEALKKVKSLFDDVDLEAEFKSDLTVDNCDTNVTHSSGFKTASNKHINISEDAVLKAKSLFEGIESEFHNDLIVSQVNVEEDAKDIDSIKSGTFPGFSTASNKTITVSKEALGKAKMLFNDIDLQSNPDDVSPAKDLEIMKSSFPGFSTANNKMINVSEKSLLKAKMIFEDIDKNVDENCTFKKPSSIVKTSFPGFATASNKKITVSDDALLKAKALFSDIGTQSEQDTECNELIVVQASGFPGFTTGSNKKIVVSDEALSKTKHFFAGLDLEHSSTPQEVKMLKGFTTASNKDIILSEDALLKAKSMFNDLVSNDEPHNDHFENNQSLHANRFENPSNIDPINNHSTKFVGFNTASNKSIPISEKGLSEARKIFDNIDQEYETKDDRSVVAKFDTVDCKTDEVAKPFMGFSTANNDKISISEEALKKAQSVFADLDDDEKKTTAEAINVDESLRKNTVIDSCPPAKDKSWKPVNDLPKKPTSFLHISLTQEISESTKALLHDENVSTVSGDKSPSIVDDIETPSSPILPSRSKKNKKVFKAPYKEGETKICELETNAPKKRKIVVDKKVPENDGTKVSRKDVDLGNLFDEKMKRNSNSKILLKDFNRCNEGVDMDVSNINPENFEQFVFKNERIDIVIENLKNEVTVSDLIQIFTNNSNVDRKLIPERWVVNHIKWIMWKLASYECFFGGSFSGILTVGNVLKQLKLRYDKELYRAERPLLRKILECDDVPGRKMVLCVSRIIKPSHEEGKGEPLSNIASYELEVTDGWYSVLATIDSLLIAAVRNGKLTVGTKIITCGAELHNCGQGKSPLEDVSEVRLRLHGNSTRVAPWHSKLGACHDARLLRIGAETLRARAGPVPVLCLLPIVVYPQLFVEKLPTGDTVTRSERLEQVYLSSMEGEIQARVEELYVEAEREVLEERRAAGRGRHHRRGAFTAGRGSRGELDDEEMLDMMEEANDPGEIMASLSLTQHERILNCAARKQAERREKIDARVKGMMQERGVGTTNRKVVSILKVRGLILELNRDERKVTPVLLTVWKVQESTLDLLNRMQLLHLYWATPTGLRMGELHLSTSKQTLFTEIKNQKHIDKYPEVQKYIRKCTSISDMNHSSFKPTFNEVDTVGLVFKIEPSIMTLNNHSASKNSLQMSPNMQTVYMCDDNMNIIAVHFWGGIVKFGYEKTVESGKILACCNLQHRPRSSRKRFRNLYATEYSTFSQCPRRRYLQDSYKILENKLKLLHLNDFLEQCRNRLVELANISNTNSFSSVNSSSNNVSNSSSIRNNSDFNVRLKRKLELNENSISGLDFDLSFGEPASSNMEKRQPNLGRIVEDREIVSALDVTPSDVDHRIKKLRIYEEPPPLSPIVLNVSKTLRKEFVTPQKDTNDSIIGYDSTRDFEGSKSVNVSEKRDSEDNVMKRVVAGCGENADSDPFKENFIYSPPDLE